MSEETLFFLIPLTKVGDTVMLQGARAVIKTSKTRIYERV